MRIRITLDIFSGQSNPSWIIQGVDAKKTSDLINGILVAKIVVVATEYQIPSLGYRGFCLEQSIDEEHPYIVRVFGPYLLLKEQTFLDQNHSLETWLRKMAKTHVENQIWNAIFDH